MTKATNLNRGFLYSPLCAHALRTLAKQGIPAEEVLRGTDISTVLLEDYGNVITYPQALSLLENAFLLSPSKDLGLVMGTQLTVSHCGYLGLGVMGSETPGKALELINRFYRAWGLMLKPRVSRELQMARLQIHEEYPVGKLYRFLTEELLSATLSIYRWITGERFALCEARFTFKEPDYSDRYKEVFACDCYFNCEDTEFIFDGEVLDTPTLQADPLAVKACVDYFNRHMPIQNEASLSDKVRLLLRQAQGHFPDMEAIAQPLNVSVRTLRRQLQSEGTSFQQLLEDTRQQQSKQYLRHTSLTLDEIASLLGYSEQSQFSRAFRRWTGVSPGHFRSSISDT